MAFFIPVFKQLNAADVRYVVVGDVATILHGYVRATTDIDLIVDLQVEEAENKNSKNRGQSTILSNIRNN